MAKIVIAGVADCPRYARTELLADQLALNLPDFQLHKITKLPDEWENWLADICTSYGWSHRHSPIVWRELIDRGGKGVLIGGANEFQEYASAYYGVLSEFTSDDALKVAGENLQMKQELVMQHQAAEATAVSIRVCVTAASGAIGYSVVSAIASGDVFGCGAPLSLILCDTDDNLSALSGIAMEAVDIASGSVHDTSVTSDLTSAFRDCDIVILLEDIACDAEDERSSWLQRVYEHYAAVASAIQDSARQDVKVVVGGCETAANFVGTIICRTAPGIPPENVIVSSRFLENRARGAIGRHTGVNPASIIDLVVWGDAGGKNGRFAVDASQARIYDCEQSAIWGPGHFVPAAEVVHDDNWLRTELPRLVATGNVQYLPGSMAAASALSSLVRDWWCGMYRSRIHSVAVCSQGWYDIPDGIFFSLPVKFTAPKKYSVVNDLELTDDVRERLPKIIEELESDVEVIFPNPDKPVRPEPSEHSFSPTDLPLESEPLQDSEIIQLASDEESVKTEADLDFEEPVILEKIIEDSEGEQIAAQD